MNISVHPGPLPTLQLRSIPALSNCNLLNKVGIEQISYQRGSFFLKKNIFNTERQFTLEQILVLCDWPTTSKYSAQIYFTFSYQTQITALLSLI